MIDTHCHLLPGLDDGAPDEHSALTMARIALADGVRAIVVTPHMREADYLNERPTVLAALERFRAVLLREQVPLELFAGSEVHLGPRLPERIGEERLLTYGDQRRYLLLECPYKTRPVNLAEQVFQLKMAGITPVLAHPERIRHFQEEPEKYEDAIRQGALGQMTTSSLLGRFGKSIQKLSESWVSRGLVHVLGSDAHDAEYRPPKLSAARTRWTELAGEESARLATEEWPLAFVLGRDIDPDPPRPEEKPIGLWGRLFGRS